jgi:Ycf66 protein N-terminus
MLAYILAVLVGTGSVGLYLSAFFFPEIHRKQDFIWSGAGFFYALILWIYARQETGGILLGQTTSVVLLGWLAWQNLQLRRQLVPVNQQTPMPSTTKIKEKLGVKQIVSKQSVTVPKQSVVKPATPTAPKPTPQAPQVSTTTAAQPTAPPATPPAPKAAARPPVQPKVVSIEDHMPKPVQQVFQPVNLQQPVEAEEAWIKLEVKPAVAPAKPLGTAVQPPTPAITTSQPESAGSPAVAPEIVTNNSPIDLNQALAELESENWD